MPLTIAQIDVGVLFVLAITSVGVYGIALAGWSSNTKYTLMGGLRSSAQMISYELAMGASVIGVVMLSGTLDLNGIIYAQIHSPFQMVYHSAIYRLYRFFDRGICGNEPRAVRFARSRNRTRRRISHGIFRSEIRALFYGGIRQYVHGFGDVYRFISGRLVYSGFGAYFRARFDSVCARQPLGFLLKIFGVFVFLYLGARNFAAFPF